MNKKDERSIAGGGITLASFGFISKILVSMGLTLSPFTINAMIGGGIALTIFDVVFYFNSKFDKLFTNCGLCIHIKGSDLTLTPKVIKKIKKENGVDYILTVPPGLSLTQMEQRQEAIEQHLKSSVKFSYNNGVFIMHTTNNKLERTYKFTPVHTETPLEVVVGYSREKLETISLDNSPSPHLLIAAETNGGKSVILRGMITQLILDKSEDEIELHLVDPKRVEFNIFRKSSFVKTFTREDDEIREMLDSIVKEMDTRYKLLECSECVNIKQYNKKAKQKLKYILIIIDELADLTEDKQIIKYIAILARKARAVGIHLIISTQRPDYKTLDSTIKANLGNVIGLKTSTDTNSEIIIDRPGLERLRGYGHGILKGPNGYVEMQSMFISDDEAKKLIKHTYVQKDNKQKKETKKSRGYIEL